LQYHSLQLVDTSAQKQGKTVVSTAPTLERRQLVDVPAKKTSKMAAAKTAILRGCTW